MFLFAYILTVTVVYFLLSRGYILEEDLTLHAIISMVLGLHLILVVGFMC
jgi:hypothetical protein